MEVRAGHKQTEVGVIPEDWSLKGLGDISDLDIGLSKPKIVFGSGCPVVTVQDLYGGAIVDVSSLKRVVVTADEIQRYKLQKDDILIGNASVKRDGIGYANRFDGAIEDVIFAKYAYRARSVRSVLPLFLHHVLRASFCREWIISNSQTGTLTNLNKAAARAIPITVPSTFEEQRAIAEALSDADALIESLEQLLAKKRHLKQGAMQELLTGKRRLPGFGGEWEVKTLAELFDFSGGFTASRDQLSSNGHCYLHYGDIHTSKKSFIDVQSEYQDIPKLDIALKKVSPSSLLDDGDVVFVDASEDDEGTSKHVVISNSGGAPFISGLHTIVAKGRTNALAHLYRRYCFHTAVIKAQFRYFAVGTKVSGISKTNIAKVTMPVPSVLEQTAIAAILADMDAELTALEANLTKALQIKQGMMQELLTGKRRLV